VSESRTLDKPAAVPSFEAETLDVGRSLLHFRIVARLGAGGMGVVYRAFDEKLRRAVAIKVLAPRYVVDERNKEMIFREARSAAALTHPNIAAIYELHDDASGAFLVMELVAGETLRAKIQRDRRVPAGDALRWATQIAGALARAHAAGVVHRDLKADNVMIADDGQVKLLDFGLAKVVDAAEPALRDAAVVPATALAPTIPASDRSTEHGRIMGTPAYMSPEQARGDAVDARTDVFAFGVVLYEMLSGSVPFVRDAKLPSGDPSSGDWKARADVRELAPRVSRPFARLVERCLAVDRDARPADGTALVALLAGIPRRRRSRWVGVAALTVAAGVVAAFALRPDGRAEPSCDAAAAAIDTRWNDATRAKARARFAGARAADDLAALEQPAARWRQLRRDACVRAADPDQRALGDKQATCLDRMLDVFAAAIDNPTSAFMSRLGVRPEIPPLERCDRADPIAAVAERSINDSSAAVEYRYVLAPDARRIASLGEGHVVVKSVDEARELARFAAPTGAALVGWSADRVLVMDGRHLLATNDATRTLDAIAELPANTLSVSRDGRRALVLDANELYAVEIVGGTRSRSLGRYSRPSRFDGNALAQWSADGSQVAVAYYRDGDPNFGALHVVDVTTAEGSELPFRTDNNLAGGHWFTWLDDRVLLFVGRSDLDHGASIWSAPFRGGRPDGLVALALEAPRNAVYYVASAARGRVLADRVAIHYELARVRDGKAERIRGAPEVVGLSDVDAGGQRVSVYREAEGGVVSLADGSYESFGIGARISVLDDRVIAIDGTAIIERDASGARRTLGTIDSSPSVFSWPRCTGTACVVVSVDAARPHGERVYRFTPLGHDGSDKPTAVAPSQNLNSLALSPGGRRVAFVDQGDAGGVEVVELASGRRDRWPVSIRDGCHESFDAVAWAPRGDVVYLEAQCPVTSASQLFRLERGKDPVSVLRSSGFILGVAVPADDVPIINVKYYDSRVVIVDGL
jgi:tRNA A-37 threonylcarbamoyl transferase component Bud32